MKVQKVTIGATGRDYATLSSFAAAFDNTLVADPWTYFIAELRNDSTFTDHDVSIAVPSNVGFFLLTAADGEWHEGDVDSGVLFQPTSSHSYILSINGITTGYRIEKIRFDANGNNVGLTGGCVRQGTSVDVSDPTRQHFDRLIVTGGGTNPARGLRGIDANGRPAMVTNTLVYDLVSNGSATSSIAFGIGGDERLIVKNCTVDNVDFTNNVGVNYGIQKSNSAYPTRDCVVTRIKDGGGGGSECIDGTEIDGCVTEDSSGNTTGAVHTDEFNNPSSGDYTLKAGADAAGHGTEVGPNPRSTEWTYVDITGQTKEMGTTNDAGAYNNQAGYEAEAGGGSTLIVVED